jgi:phospholipid/cholesterol/gamma-HCH transport system permease protein
MINAIGNIGRAAMLSTSSLRGTLAFAARVFLNFFDRRSYNSASRMVFVSQLYFTSVQILPLFLFIGVIFGALINGVAFHAVKNMDYLGRLLMGFVVTELSPFVTVLLIALRSSSAINAEIAVMKVNREMNTLEKFRIDQIHYLFIPRILNGMFSMVFLTSLFALVVLSVGLLVSNLVFGTGVDAYIDTLLHSTNIPDIVILLVKCATFGFFITLIPIHIGLNASEELTSIPIAVLNGMVKVFMAIVTIEVLSSIVRLI